MSTKTAVERLNNYWATDASWFKPECRVVALEDAMKFAMELDAARATLKEIAEKGGKWGAEMARRRLGVAE